MGRGGEAWLTGALDFTPRRTPENRHQPSGALRLLFSEGAETSDQEYTITVSAGDLLGPSGVRGPPGEGPSGEGRSAVKIQASQVGVECCDREAQSRCRPPCTSRGEKPWPTWARQTKALLSLWKCPHPTCRLHSGEGEWGLGGTLPQGFSAAWGLGAHHPRTCEVIPALRFSRLGA